MTSKKDIPMNVFVPLMKQLRGGDYRYTVAYNDAGILKLAVSVRERPDDKVTTIIRKEFMFSDSSPAYIYHVFVGHDKIISTGTSILDAVESPRPEQRRIRALYDFISKRAKPRIR